MPPALRRTSPGEDPRCVPERGARALPAASADLVVRARGPLVLWVLLDVGVQPESAPQWLPSHEPTLGVATCAGKGTSARHEGLLPVVAPGGLLNDTCSGCPGCRRGQPVSAATRPLARQLPRRWPRPPTAGPLRTGCLPATSEDQV